MHRPVTHRFRTFNLLAAAAMLGAAGGVAPASVLPSVTPGFDRQLARWRRKAEYDRDLRRKQDDRLDAYVAKWGGERAWPRKD